MRVWTATAMHDKPLPRLRHGQTCERIGDGKLKITGKCVMSGKDVSFEAREAGVDAWLNGAYIQEALHDVSRADREFLLSGLSDAAFDEMFAEEEEEEEDIEGEGTRVWNQSDEREDFHSDDRVGFDSEPSEPFDD